MNIANPQTWIGIALVGIFVLLLFTIQRENWRDTIHIGIVAACILVALIRLGSPKP